MSALRRQDASLLRASAILSVGPSQGDHVGLRDRTRLLKVLSRGTAIDVARLAATSHLCCHRRRLIRDGRKTHPAERGGWVSASAINRRRSTPSRKRVYGSTTHQGTAS